jgi:hypothetical protein
MPLLPLLGRLPHQSIDDRQRRVRAGTKGVLEGAQPMQDIGEQELPVAPDQRPKGTGMSWLTISTQPACWSSSPRRRKTSISKPNCWLVVRNHSSRRRVAGPKKTVWP